MRVNKTEIPSGLMLKKVMNPNNLSIENANRRMMLEAAVEEADLNVTERLALNKTFFPNGNGFNLFPETKSIHQYNYFYSRLNPPEKDTFIKEAEAIKVPAHVCRTKTNYYPSSQNSLQANLKLALKKLKKVISFD